MESDSNGGCSRLAAAPPPPRSVYLGSGKIGMLIVTERVSMLLMDAKAPLTQATVNVYLLNTFRHLFTLSDSPLSIRFNNETGLKDLTDPGSPIPQERFRFCNDELLGLANTNTHLPGNPLIFLENMSLINRSTLESWMRIKEHGLTESFLRACPIGIMPDGSGGEEQEQARQAKK
ncbi:hypothetical protein YC2023_076911 [Brassica napus]